jgi:hypothetical protein
VNPDVWTPDHSREQEEVDALVKANGDRALLDRLVRSGKVKALPNAMWHRKRPAANPTIRPNAKKARKRGRK